MCPEELVELRGLFELSVFELTGADQIFCANLIGMVTVHVRKRQTCLIQ